METKLLEMMDQIDEELKHKKSLESGLTPILVIWLLMISFTYSKKREKSV